jgi:hypothetical protein
VEATMSNAALDALERLYVNVRPEYPFGVRDWELVKDALERAERERDAAEWAMGQQRQMRLHAEARAQKAEAALTEILERPHGELDEHEMRSIAHAALTSYDEPPTEQIPGSGHPTC